MDQFAKRALAFANNLSGHTCHFLFETGQRPFCGGECIIFALEATGRRIGVRIEQKFTQSTHVKVAREVQLLEAIRREQISHLPSLIGYDLDSTPPMIATGWADGHKLEWTEFTPTQPFRNNILKTVAKVTLDLLQIQESGRFRTVKPSWQVPRKTHVISHNPSRNPSLNTSKYLALV